MMLMDRRIIVRTRVSFLKKQNKWHAYIKYCDGGIKDLGYFDSQKEAQDARNADLSEHDGYRTKARTTGLNSGCYGFSSGSIRECP